VVVQIQSQLLPKEEVLSGESPIGSQAKPDEPQYIQQQIERGQQQENRTRGTRGRVDLSTPRIVGYFEIGVRLEWNHNCFHELGKSVIDFPPLCIGIVASPFSIAVPLSPKGSST
jgi:hypothetical protein